MPHSSKPISLTSIIKRPLQLTSLFFLGTMLLACGSGGEEDKTIVTKVGSVVLQHSKVSPNSRCPNGGIEVKTGIDDNGNGTLDEKEVDVTQLVCNGTDGSNGTDGTNGTDGSASLLDITKQVAGDQCPNGGVHISTGIDVDGNGVLDTAEVTKSTTACFGSAIAKEYSALSGSAKIKGNIDLSSLSKSNVKVQRVVNKNHRQTVSRHTTQQNLVEVTSDSLLLIPSKVTAVIQKNDSNNDAEVAPPTIEPIKIEIDAAGNYEVEVPAGTDYSLFIVDQQSNKGVKLEQLAVGPGETLTQDISAKDFVATGSVSFEIASLASGQVLIGASVTLIDLGIQTTTSDLGQAEFDQLPPGTYALMIDQKGFVSKYQSFTIDSGQVTNLQTIELNNQMGSAVGQIQAEGLQSQTNLLIYARASDNSVYSTLTNASGTFKFPALPVGNHYSFIVAANDFESVKVDNIDILTRQTTTIDTLFLKRVSSNEGSITGFARFSKNLLQNHAGIIVSVEGTDKEAITSRNGAFIINGLSPNDYTLNITDSNHQAVTLDSVSIVSSTTTNLDLVTLKGWTGSVTGQVKNPDGTGISGVTVRTTYAEMTTNQQGYFSLSGVLTGEQSVSFAKEGFVSQSIYVDIVANEATALTENISLIPYSFSGVISLGDNVNDHSGISVLLDGSSNISTFTNKNGSFGFAGATPGNYQLTFSGNGYRSQSVAVTITDDVTNYVLPYTIALDRIEGILKGVVTLIDQLDHSGTLVKLAGTNYSTFTNALGEWSMKVPTGNYSNGIIYSKALYGSNTKSDTITITEYGDYVSSPVVFLQTLANFSLNVSAVGSCQKITLLLTGHSGHAIGYNAEFSTDAQGLLPAIELPLGDYTSVVACIDSGWESYTFNTKISSGVLNVALEAVNLRHSYVKINGEDIFTNNPVVTLSIGNTDAAEMKITEGVNDSGWVAYSTSYNHELSAGDGLKTLSISFRDSNSVELSAVQDTIMLDTTLNIKIFTATGASSKGDKLHFLLDLSGEVGATVTASVAGLIEGLPLLDNGFGGDALANDGIYERDYQINSAVDLKLAASALVIDIAGNRISVDSSTSIVLNTAPAILNITTSSNVAAGEMTLRFSTDEPATARIEYGSDLASLSDPLPISMLVTKSHHITLTGLSPNSITYYRVTVEDSANNTRQLKGQGKLAPPPIAGLGAYPGNNEVGLIWDLAQNATGYRIYRSSDGGTVFTLVNPTNLITEKYYVDVLVSNNTSYTYKVTAIDIDGNESVDSSTISVAPQADLAGPTTVAGGVIDTNTVWLKSRSPYQITAKLKVKKDRALLLLPGTEIIFSQPDLSIYLSGVITALGQSSNPVVISGYKEGSESYSGALIYDINNHTNSELNYTELNFLKVYYDYSDNGDRSYYLVPIALNHSTVNGYNNNNYHYQSDFYIKQASHSVFNEYGDGSSLIVGSVVDVTFNKLNSAGQPAIITSAIATIHSAINSRFNGAGFNFRDGTINNSQFSDAVIQQVSSITKSTLSNTLVDGYSSLRVMGSTLTNSKINLSGDNARLTMHYNVLDAESTINAKLLDISHNYWGSTNLTEIAKQTSYSTSVANNTHLYPIITGSDIYLADWDGDGLPDYLDYDNDNDGYSDLQEDWQSDPVYGSIFNPLDSSSHPATEKDNDMDGLPDATDLDDDNDGLADNDELIRLTDPYLADSDGDGVSDGDEVRFKYNPLDKTNYPLMGNIAGITIDHSNVNSDGVVYISGYEQYDEMMEGVSIAPVSLNGVTVSAGIALMIDKDTRVSFIDSIIEGNANNVITIRSTGAGSGRLRLKNTKIAFSNIKLAISFNSDSSSSIDRSDLSLSKNFYNNATITNSSIILQSEMTNNGSIADSYIGGVNYNQLRNHGLIKNSYLSGNIQNNGVLNNSYINELSIYADGSVNASIVQSLNTNGAGSSNDSVVIDSDVRLNYAGESNLFFDNSFIRLGHGDHFYDGYGSPLDQNGDGVATTSFTAEYENAGLSNGTWLVDGINDPRSTPNFTELKYQPYLAIAATWSPENVGAWWDMNNPNNFSEIDPNEQLGTITGKVSLSGYDNHSGVQVAVTNTALSTTTDPEGNWSIRLPSRDYSNGISFSKDHFSTVTKSRSYLVEAQATVNVGVINMNQTTAQLSGVLSIDEASDYTLATISATRNGQITTINASASGQYQFSALPVGNYSFAITYPNGSWETITHQLNLVAGQAEYTLPLSRVRNSFVYINAGALYTNSNTVSLAISNANATNMLISEGNNSPATEMFAAEKELVLSAGDGEKIVQVDFTNAQGVSLTAAISSIVLDTQVNLTSLTLSPVSTINDTLHLVLNANEPDGMALVSIPGLVDDLLLFDNGLSGDTVANDGIYERDYVIDSAVDVTTVATAKFTDRAGNIASINSSTQLTVATSPTISALLTQTVNNQLIISFITNELTTASIVYGTDQTQLDQNATISVSGATEHSITLNVAADQPIYFVITTDDGVTAATVITSNAVISNPAVKGINSSAGDREIGLVWNKHQDAVSYRIYRSDDNNHFSQLAEAAIDAPYYVDSSVSNGQRYYYRVTWFNQDGAESDQTASVSGRAAQLLAGPTEMVGGVIAVNTIWLKSGSPYIITDNMLIREQTTLSLMPGTQIEFNGSARHIMNRGSIMAYGSADDIITISTDPAYRYDSTSQAAIIYDTANHSVSEFNYTELNYLKVYYDYTDSYTRYNYLVPLALTNSSVNGYYSYLPDFYIKSATASVFNEYGYGSSGREALRVGTVVNVTFNHLDSAGNASYTTSIIASINNAITSHFNDGGFYFNNGNIDSSIFNHAIVQAVATITKSTLTDSSVSGESSLRLTGSTLSNTQLTLNGDHSRLTMHYNVLDSASTVSAKLLDISYNYWGSTDLVRIASQTGYSPEPSANTHLYPIITTSELYLADWDGDGVPDYLDYDNDNDGYSDLQEDWESDLSYGSIFNPLDQQSHPLTATDNDMDGISDLDDIDDDNDDLTDTDELNYGTNPYLADSDGDGVNDGNEVKYGYDPLDKANFPLMNNMTGITIDGSNVNNNGVVYIVGYESTDEMMSIGSIAPVYFTGVTVSAGTSLMINKDTTVYFIDSILEGNPGNIIKIRASGTGNGGLKLNNSTVTFANIKLGLSLSINETATIDRSDISMGSSSNLSGTISNSFITSNSTWYNYGIIRHSYIAGSSNYNHKLIDSSYLNLNDTLNNNGALNSSYSIGYVYLESGGSLAGSVLERFGGSDYGTQVTGSDVAFYYPQTMSIFFDNSYITDSSDNPAYDGYGSPIDRIGDGIAETRFNLSGSEYTVDGINNPRSTKNFPNGAADLWNSEGVGALWDPTATEPTHFPEPGF